MKKQVKKLSKRILVLGLATSIIFTSCFSYKKINAHATSIVAGLGAYTLYEICLYIGGLAITTLGIGYAYENRDEIAEFGKSVIDKMTDLSSTWVLGSSTKEGNYVYGTEALQEIQDTQWSVIQGGGQSPKNDNDGDGDKDNDDIELELRNNGYFLTSAGVMLLGDKVKSLREEWQNKDIGHNSSIENSLLDEKFGFANKLSFDPTSTLPIIDGYYNGTVYVHKILSDGSVYTKMITTKSSSTDSCGLAGYVKSDGEFRIVSGPASASGVWLNSYYYYGSSSSTSITITDKPSFSNEWKYYSTNIPMFVDEASCLAYFKSGSLNGILNLSSTFTVADWIDEEDDWRGHLEDIATSLRSLQDLTSIAQALSEGALTTQPSANEYGDMMDNLGTEYAPKTDPIIEPTYYPATNTTPQLDPSVFPNYVPPTVPDSGGTDSPSGDGTEEVPEIDLDGLLSIFNILFYLIMIIVMLIYLFLSCLAFIVMIFRIPASSSMLPEDMVLGYEHLKTIMIPGMNISIYGFAMALIYLFIIFAVIKLIRLEINDFKFPRSYK